jgi:16S rRNA (cytidine1402-2'-O)-methyltransferase
VVTALSVSGMDTGRFTFEGFLSTNNKNRREHLEEVRNEKRTMVFYEAPHKLLRTLEDMLAAWGDRPIALCRELTKMYEEVRRTTLAEAVEYYRENAPRGEFVLVIGGCTAPAQPEDPVDLLAEVGQRIEDGMSLMSAVKEVSRLHNSPKNALYRQALERFGNE